MDEEGNGWGIAPADRTHLAIFGKPGEGKSTLMYTLMADNADKGEGFLLLDPHGDLARGVEGEIGSDLSLPTKGISLDPLPLGWPRSSFVLDSLSRYYGEDWGPRLEMIFRNALKVSKVRDVFALRDFLEDPKVPDGDGEEVKRFWSLVYPRLERGSEAAVLNKLDKMVSDERAAAFLSGEPLDVLGCLDGGKKVTVSLDEGRLGSDLSSFLGSLLLGHVYFAGMGRNSRSPFFVYVDEAHRFSWSELEVGLAALRKRGVFFTLASQSLEQFDGRTDPLSFSDSIVSFSVSPRTARSLSPLFQPIGPETLSALPRHLFAVRTAASRGLAAFLYTLGR
ncbi:MAG: DUF87 domain-containing protein [Candidatus Marsarchaeota archaeon]